MTIKPFRGILTKLTIYSEGNAGVAQWSGHQPSKLGMRVRFPSPAPRPNTWTKCLKSRAERFRDGTNDDEFRGATPLYLASIWEHSSIGRAPALQAGGRRFDSRWFHHTKLNDVGVAEQADAADLKSAGIHPCGFDSRLRHHSKCSLRTEH